MSCEIGDLKIFSLILIKPYGYLSFYMKDWLTTLSALAGESCGRKGKGKDKGAGKGCGEFSRAVVAVEVVACRCQCSTRIGLSSCVAFFPLLGQDGLK